MDQRKNEASITITLAGGPIQETVANSGITEAAMRAWDRPATSRLSSTQIRDLMTGAKVRVWGATTGDTATLTVSGDAAELERGSVAYLVLTDPIVSRPSSSGGWRRSGSPPKGSRCRCWPYERLIYPGRGGRT
jgi:hypothetical protein